MRLWTNGRTTLSMNPGGLSVYVDGRPTEHRQITAPPAAKQKGAAKRSLVLSVNEARAIVLAGESEGLLFLLDLKGKFPPRQLQQQVIDTAVASAAEFLVAAAPAGKKGAGVEFTLTEFNKDGSSKVIASLDAPSPKKVKWPSGMGTAAWSSESEISRKGLRMSANDSGVTVADAATGMLFVLRADSEKFDFGLHLPVEDAPFFYATATPKGVLTVTPSGKGAALCHFAPDGKCLGSKLLSGTIVGAPVLIADAHAAIVVNDTLHELELPSLSTLSSADLGLKLKTPLQLAVVDEQKLFAGTETTVWLLTRQDAAAAGGDDDEDTAEEAAGGWANKVLPSAQDKSSLVPPDAEAIKGPPSLQVSQPAFSPRTWAAKAGSTAALSLLLANNGGEARGLKIELSGEAVKKSLIKPVRAVLGQEKVDFKQVSPEKYLAEAPALMLEGAVEGPTEDAPPVSRLDAELQLELKAQGQGSGLLMIRLASQDRQNRGSTCAFGRLFEVTKK